MRRFLAILVMGMLLAVANVAAAGAAKNTTSSTSQVLGTYTYSDGGNRITVGYICPGSVGAWGVVDQYANYYAQLRSKSWTMSITRHAAWKLDVSMYEIWGVHLSPQAWASLEGTAATASC